MAKTNNLLYLRYWLFFLIIVGFTLLLYTVRFYLTTTSLSHPFIAPKPVWSYSSTSSSTTTSSSPNPANIPTSSSPNPANTTTSSSPNPANTTTSSSPNKAKIATSSSPNKANISTRAVQHLKTLVNTSLCSIRQDLLEAPPFRFTLLPLTSLPSCSQPNRVTPLFLILVHSARQQKENRDAIRSSWGSVNRKTMYGAEFLLRFILGSSGRESIGADEVIEEQRRHQDLVVTSIVDSYDNLTFKHLAALKYQQTHCPGAAWVVKTDDDVFVNLPRAVDTCTMLAAHLDLFCPYFGVREGVGRTGKWAIAPGVYPYPTFPTYCHGQLVFYQSHLVHRLLEAARTIPCHLWLDDVYVTGVLVELVGGRHRADSQHPALPDDLWLLLHGERNLGQVLRRMWKNVE